jgi:hypothetical protein
MSIHSLNFTNGLNKVVFNKALLNSSSIYSIPLNNYPISKPIRNIPVINNQNNIFDKNRVFYVCSSGGCGSTVIFNYLKNFGTVYHIHDRYPPNKLEYIGNTNTEKDVYSEWFNGVEIPENELSNYKVIFIYRNPIKVIFSRFAQRKGPNVSHLQHIKCDNNGNINIYDVLKTEKDLYKLEEFFDNYTKPSDKNYKIHCVKYELFWDNIALFNKTMGIPDIKSLYPVKQEKPKQLQFLSSLTKIYFSLINKMNFMRFIEIVEPIQHEKET